jgi:hypothetical protein
VKRAGKGGSKTDFEASNRRAFQNGKENRKKAPWGQYAWSEAMIISAAC